MATTAVVSVEAGRLDVTVIAWHLAAWLITMRALRPLVMQRSNSARNSAAVMAGGDSVQVVFSTRTFASPLATLAHMGGPREVWAQRSHAEPQGRNVDRLVKKNIWNSCADMKCQLEKCHSLVITVRDGADFKNKLMGVMVYF